MTKKIIISGDLHDDVEAAAVMADFANAKNADWMLCDGDLTHRAYTREHLKEFLEDDDKNAESLEKFIKKKNKLDIEAFLKKKRTHNERILKDFKATFDKSGVNYFLVGGNYDPDLTPIFGDHNLHFNARDMNGIKITGYGGADLYPQHIQLLRDLGKRMGTEEIVEFKPRDLYQFMKREKNDLAIALFHNPVWGYCDNVSGIPRGSRAEMNAMKDFSFKVAIAGHIHGGGPLGKNKANGQGVTKYENPNNGKTTYMFNPGNLGRFSHLDFPSMEIAETQSYGTFIELDSEDDATPLKLTQYTIAGPEGNGPIDQVKKLRDFNLKE